MADVYNVSTGAVALVASTEKTVLQVATDANNRAKVGYISVSFDGAASASPALVQMERQTTAGTMSSVTPAPLDPDAPACSTTAQYNATAEPTSGTKLFDWYVVPNGGLFAITFAPGEEPVVDVSGRIGITVNSPASCNCTVNMTFVE